MLVESTQRKCFSDVRTRRLYILLFSVPCNNRNNKDVLALRDVQLSLHKDAHNSDSEDYDDIGLSSEEEAGDLEENPAIRRKYNKPTAPPPPVPVPEPGTSEQSSGDKVEVSKQVLEQAFLVLGQLLKGEAPTLPSAPTGPQVDPVINPFKVYRAKEGEKMCNVCSRKFWKTETLRRHQKTHLGTQKWTCMNENCGRKLANKRSFDQHQLSCGKEKRFFCKVQDCESTFATKEMLQVHGRVHRKKLTRKQGVCKGCKKEGFTRQKSLDDHWRFCSGNPNHVGPFPCPVQGCQRGPSNPFNHTRNHTQHMNDVHGFDLKHSK